MNIGLISLGKQGRERLNALTNYEYEKEKKLSISTFLHSKKIRNNLNLILR